MPVHDFICPAPVMDELSFLYGIDGDCAPCPLFPVFPCPVAVMADCPYALHPYI